MLTWSARAFLSSAFCDSVIVESLVDISISTETNTASTVVGATVGATEGPGLIVGRVLKVGDRVYEGNDVGLRLGTTEGTFVGTGDGGRVYSITIVDEVIVELAVAFLLAVMFTPVIFALASLSAFVRLPLRAAEVKSNEKVLVKFATLPA